MLDALLMMYIDIPEKMNSGVSLLWQNNLYSSMRSQIFCEQ